MKLHTFLLFTLLFAFHGPYASAQNCPVPYKSIESVFGLDLETVAIDIPNSLSSDGMITYRFYSQKVEIPNGAGVETYFMTAEEGFPPVRKILTVDPAVETVGQIYVANNTFNSTSQRYDTRVLAISNRIRTASVDSVAIADYESGIESGGVLIRFNIEYGDDGNPLFPITVDCEGTPPAPIPFNQTFQSTGVANTKVTLFDLGVYYRNSTEGLNGFALQNSLQEDYPALALAVASIEQDTSTLMTKHASLESQVGTLTSNYSTVISEVESASTTISDLSPRVAHLEDTLNASLALAVGGVQSLMVSQSLNGSASSDAASQGTRKIGVPLEAGKSYACTLLSQSSLLVAGFATTVMGPSSELTGNLIGDVAPQIPSTAADSSPKNNRISVLPTEAGTHVLSYSVGSLGEGASQFSLQCLQTSLYGAYNTVINSINFLELENSTSSPVNGTIYAYNFDSPPGQPVASLDFSIAANSRQDFDLHSRVGQQKFGNLVVSHSGPLGSLKGRVAQYRGTASDFEIATVVPLSTREQAF